MHPVAKHLAQGRIDDVNGAVIGCGAAAGLRINLQQHLIPRRQRPVHFMQENFADGLLHVQYARRGLAVFEHQPRIAHLTAGSGVKRGFVKHGISFAGQSFDFFKFRIQQRQHAGVLSQPVIPRKHRGGICLLQSLQGFDFFFGKFIGVAAAFGGGLFFGLFIAFFVYFDAFGGRNFPRQLQREAERFVQVKRVLAGQGFAFSGQQFGQFFFSGLQGF